MQLYNIKVPITNDTTPDVLFQQLSIDKDEHFCYSAQMQGNILKLNCPEDIEAPYTPRAIVDVFLVQHKHHLNPPIELFLETHKSLMHKHVERAYNKFNKFVPDKDDMRSMWLLSVSELFYKDYYVHAGIIWKTFINHILLEIRSLYTYIADGIKHSISLTSLDEEISDEEGNVVTKLDLIVDEQATQQAYEMTHYTEKDAQEEKLEQLREAALKNMSQIAYDNLLLKLNSKTMDTSASKKIMRLRKELNPGAPSRRPNRQTYAGKPIAPRVVTRKEQK